MGTPDNRRITRCATLLGFGVTALAMGCGICRTPTSFTARCIDYQCTELDINGPRTAAVYLARDAVVLLRADGARRIPYRAHGCLAQANRRSDLLRLSPDGWRAILHGTRSRMKWDLWGHSGRRVSIACVVDFRRRTVRPLSALLPTTLPKRSGEVHWGASGRHLYVWKTSNGLDLEVMDLPRRRSTVLTLLAKDRPDKCALREVSGALVVACVTHRIPAGAKTWDTTAQDLLVQRLDLRQWPPTAGPLQRIALPGYGSPGGITLSRTGRFLAHFATSEVRGEGRFLVWRRSHYGVVDLHTRRHRFLRHEVHKGRKVSNLEFSPTEDRLLLGEFVSRRPIAHSRVRRLRLDGTTERTHDLPWILDRLYWPPGSTGFWAVGGCEARRIR